MVLLSDLSENKYFFLFFSPYFFFLFFFFIPVKDGYLSEQQTEPTPLAAVWLWEPVCK